MNRKWNKPASLITAGVSLTLLAGAAHAQNSPQQGRGTSQVQGTPTGAAAASATIVNGQYREGSANQGTGSQATNGRRATNSTRNQNGRNSARSVPASSVSGNATPILQRAAEMWRESRQRAASAPTGARESYLAAVNAFQKMFRSYGVSPGAATTGRGTTVTSSQASDDVRTLRAGRKITAASLYATGAKEFFTAQLREALLGSNSSAPIVLRGDGRGSNRPVSTGRTGMASSAVQQPPVDPTMQQGVIVQPVVPVVPGGTIIGPANTIIGPGNTVIGPGNTVIGPGNQLPQFNPQPLPQFGTGLPAPGTTVLPGAPQPTQPTQPVVPVTPVPPPAPPPAPVPPPVPGQPGTP